MQELYRLRFLFCNDRRFSSALWRKRSFDQEGVDYAHQFDVTVEGELGVLAGVEDEVSSDHHTYTCLLYTSTGTVQVELDPNGVPMYDIKEGVAWDNIPFTPALEELARNCLLYTSGD